VNLMQKTVVGLFLFLFSFFQSWAGYVQGRVVDEKGIPLAYANIYIKNSTYGVSSNINGEYFLELKSGKHTLVFSYLGYLSVEKEVQITSGKGQTINVTLKSSSREFDEVVITDNKKDLAKSIMKNVREKRSFYFDQVESYTCKTYLKTSIEKEYVEEDTSEVKNKKERKKAENLEEHLKKERINLIESIFETNYKSPNKYKEIVLAHHDYIPSKKEIGASVEIGASFGEDDMIPKPSVEKNPYLIYEDILSCDFNFFKNLIDYPAISQQPILSPMAATAPLNYTFYLKGSFYEEGKKTYEIEVKPLFKEEALFYGSLFVEDSTWQLKAVDLRINGRALFFCKEFRIIQNYVEVEENVILPVRREIFYTIKDGKNTIFGNTRINHSEYEINKEFPNRFFNNELKYYKPDAFDKDSIYWQDLRPIQLKNTELEFINVTDSIAAYYTSDEYYRKIDSAYNRISIWTPLSGLGRRNRAKGTQLYIGSLLAQVKPLGIGGYRHALPIEFNKEFSNGMLLETEEYIDYGFNNQDLKAKLGVGLTYIPLKFVRTFIRVGDVYEMVNDYASIEQVFARSNYVRAKTFSISQRMEIVNGLFGEFTFNFSDQIPLKNIQFAEWSELLFGELNEPADFDRYIKSEFKLELRYRIKQKYIIKGNKKIIIGTDFPELFFVYRKGVPGLFNSEVKFDFIELGTKGEIGMGRFGLSRWQVFAGGFINQSDLRLLEYKYFRGSDRFFFSDPLQSFQLLGQTFLTSNEYFRANYIHHFQGSILDKVPLINWLGLELAGGAGTIMIPDESIAHIEMFGGLQKVFKIKKQLFRVGVYGVTADNSLGEADFTWKFGLSFFNGYSNKWTY
jgi:hypothetical protein